MKRDAYGKEAQMANAQIKIFLQEMRSYGQRRALEQLKSRINAIRQNYNFNLQKFLDIIINALDKLEIDVREKPKYVVVRNPDDSYTTGKRLTFKSRRSRARKSRVRKSRVRKSRVRKSRVRKSRVRKSGARKSGARKSRVRKSRVRKSRVRKSGARKSGARKSRVRKSGARKSRVRKSKKIIDGRQHPRLVLQEDEDEQDEEGAGAYLKYLLDTAIEIIFSGRNPVTRYGTNFESAKVRLQDGSLYDIEITDMDMDTQRFKMSVSQDGRMPYVSNYINDRGLIEYAEYVRNQLF